MALRFPSASRPQVNGALMFKDITCGWEVLLPDCHMFMTSMLEQGRCMKRTRSSFMQAYRAQPLSAMASAERSFHLTFCDKHDSSLEALRRAFDGFPNIAFVAQDICSLNGFSRASAFCSVGNSFGIMDGGVDWAIRKMLSSPGDSVQPRCQAVIAEQFLGEQPVGTCTLIPAPMTEVFDWLAYAPTMVIPEDCRGTRNPDLAFRSLLTTQLRHNASSAEPIRSMAVTSLCTASGNVSDDDAPECEIRAQLGPF